MTDLVSKWSKILEHADMPAIRSDRKQVIAQLLENQATETQKQQEITSLFEDVAPANVTAQVGKYDPVLISLVRRAMPNLIAYDTLGVQAMKGPTGLIFAMRPHYRNADRTQGAEAFYNEANTAFSGQGTHGTPLDPFGITEGDIGRPITTAAAEALGSEDGDAFPEMGFEIEKVAVEAKSRALKASYSIEMAQDLKAIHGLDAEAELAQILSAEILAEINREIIRTIYRVAKVGAQNNDLANAGTFDLEIDSNGRWAVEKFKGLAFQLDRDANRIAQETRRGKGNFIICSSDVASALSLAGRLVADTKLTTDLQVDDTGNTYAGMFDGKYKVFIDPYAVSNYYVIGYKGASQMDAGMYYAPYVPLQMFKAISDETFQPKIGFKTRYGLVQNPFARGLAKGTAGFNDLDNGNVYYRKVRIENLTGPATSGVVVTP